MSLSLLEILRLGPVVPVLIIDRVEDAVPLARALAKGGLPAIEVTLRTPAAIEAIRRIAAEVPEATVGAGTVIRAAHVEAAKAAGAKFLVSPGSTEALLDAAAESGIPMLPGAATPGEVMGHLDRGITLMKFFPAEQAGGAPMLKALASPLPEARFCPTGGVSPTNARDYLSLPNVLCVGGSWVAPKDAVTAGDWGRIEALAREAASLHRG